MGRKKRSTLMSRTIAVFISLNMQIRRDNRAELITLPLLHLTPLLVWAWKAVQLLADLTQILDNSFGRGARRWGSPALAAGEWFIHRLDHLAYSLNIGVTLTGIGLRSVLYGLGAPL